MVELYAAQAERHAGPGILSPVPEGDGVTHPRHHVWLWQRSIPGIDLLPIKSDHSFAGRIQIKLEHF